MKFIKFLALTLILTIIMSAVPFYFFKIANMTDEKFMPSIEGQEAKGIAGYITKMVKNPDMTSELSQDLRDMVLLYNDILTNQKQKYGHFVEYLLVVLDILAISFGVVLLRKTDYKIFGKSLITSGIISTAVSTIIFILIHYEVVLI